MIDEDTLLAFSRFFSDERQLEKDYVINLMLKSISVNRFSNDIEFKGGTALYMLYGLDRFSEDLDFTYFGKEKEINAKIDSFMEPIIRDFGLSYKIGKNKGNVVVRDDSGVINGIRAELFVEGPLFGRTGMRHKIKIDVSTRHDSIMKPIASRLVSRYSDVGTTIIYTMPIEEVLTEKLCALVERTKARDIYDAYFVMKYKNIPYDEKLLREKFSKRGETFTAADIRKNIRTFKASLWKEELSYLIRNLPDLSEVKELLLDNIV